MPAHSCIAIWFGPEKRSYGASTEISVREASGPENEKSNLRLPSLRAWNPRYRTVDFGSFINSPTKQPLQLPRDFNAESTSATSCPALNESSCDWAQRAPREYGEAALLVPLRDSGACGHIPWRTLGRRCLKYPCNKQRPLH